MTTRQRLRDGLTVAMRARDRVAVGALRATLAAIDNAEAVELPGGAERAGAIELAPVGVGAAEVARRELTEAQVAAIVLGEVDERLSAADTYVRVGQTERAEQLRAEAEAIRRVVHSADSGESKDADVAGHTQGAEKAQ